MVQEPADPTPIVLVQTSPQPERTAPPWLAEAVLVLEVARESRLLTWIQQSVRVARGRMGIFEVCDFFLVLVVYAVSGELTLNAFYAALGPVASVLAALWSRRHLPARSRLSRFLAAVTEPALETLRELLLADLLVHGLSGPQVGGLLDRQGNRHVLFDVDGTRQVARQRQLCREATHPPARRRLAGLCAPGYTGRKRGEVVRTRTTVQQAHSREWLGTFGAAGNGEAFADLDRACAAVVRYLAARGLEPAQGVLRLDGLYGYVRGAAAVAQHGLGYLMRAADYRLLHHPRVQQALAGAPNDTFVQPDTGTVREVFDLGPLDWTAGQGSPLRVTTRVVVTRSPVPTKRSPAVGKRQGAHMLEIFVTDRTAPGWSAQDVLSLYFARGGFEQTLSEEDKELELDRWCSGHPLGQECWQLLGQWVWNLRLRLGVAAVDPGVRRTLWAPAVVPRQQAPQTQRPAPASVPPQSAPTPPASTAPPPQTEQPAPAPAPEPPAPPLCPSAAGQVAAAAGRGWGKFAGSDFTWIQDQLRCPAGQLLSPGERRAQGDRLRILYEAPAAHCAACSQSAACRGPQVSPQRGRRVTIWFPVAPDPPPSMSPPPAAAEVKNDPPSTPLALLSPPAPPKDFPVGPQPLCWEDVPATSLRRLCRLQVYSQRVDLGPPPPLLPVLLNRSQRAHRRLDWEQRLGRNASGPRTHPWLVRLYGVPRGIDAYRASLRQAAT
jgi:hypothetical protein